MKNILWKILPIGILLILPFLFFNQAFQGKIITAGDFSGSDLLDMHLPLKYSLHDSITNGELPLWEKDLAMGFPILAEGQAGVFYPINMLLSFTKPYMALNFSIIIVFLISGIGMYIYLKSIDFSNFSALFSSIVFSYSAFFITRVKHLNLIAVAAWVPLAFFLIKKAFDSKKHIYSPILGIVIALQFLAGHPNMTFLCIFVYLIYVIYEISVRIKDNKHTNSLVFGIVFFFTSLTTGFMLSAVQIIPTLELIGLSDRQSISYQNATAYPFTLESLSTFFAPYKDGNPATGSYKPDIYTKGIFWENSSYIGLLPFALIFYVFLSQILIKRTIFLKRLSETLKMVFSGQKKRDGKNFSSVSLIIKNYLKDTNPTLIFFVILSFLSLMFMLGAQTPVFKFIWENIPGFSLFRFPNRFNLFLIMSISIITGHIAEKIIQKLVSLKENARQNISQKHSSDEEVHFSWPFGRKISVLIVLGFVVADLWVFANSYIFFTDTKDFLKKPKSAEKLLNENSDFRIYSITQYGESPYQILGWKSMEAIISLNEALAPDKNIIYGISSFNDRVWFEGGMGISRRNTVERYLLYENKDEAVFGKLLGLYNVKYILNFGGVPGIELFKEDEFDLGGIYSQKLTLTENGQLLPRVYYVPEAKVVSSEAEAFNSVTSLKHLGPKTVILEEKPEIVPLEFNGVLDTFAKENTAVITTYKDTKVHIAADIKDHGFLVLSDMNYPGWKVFVDGIEKKVLSANYLARAVELNPGKHEVVFQYDPLSFKIGFVATLASTVTILIIFLIRLIRSVVLSKRTR